MLSRTVVIAIVVAGCNPAATPKSASDDVAEPSAAPSAEAAAGCDAALANTYRVIEASGVARLQEAAAQQSLETSVAQCNQQRWPESLTSCLAHAGSVDEIYGDCYARPLRDRPLTIVRTIALLEQDRADPPLFTQDGDYLEIEEGCGVLYATATPSEALFLICDGETRGPINTPDQIDALFAGLSARSKQAHETAMSIIGNMPSGRFGGWKVCDQAGNCTIE